MAQIEESIELNVPVSTAYNQWTQFEEFPRFMEDIKEVRQLDDTHLHWRAEIGGKTQEWEAEITEQKSDERVAWKSTGGKRNSGVVTFQRLSDTSCHVTAQMEYETEGIVERIGSALGADERRVKADLESFKAMIEQQAHATGAWRGEVVSSSGDLGGDKTGGEHLGGRGGPEDQPVAMGGDGYQTEPPTPRD